MNRFLFKLSLCLFVFAAVCAFAPPTALCQTEKLGIVQYMPPKGMTKTLKDNVVAFSEFDQVTGKYCIITVYGATPGTGSAQGDFRREWNNLVVKTLDKAQADPSTDASMADGWTILAGGSPVESGAGKAIAFLTVISERSRTVSILAVFNDPAYVKQVDTFISTIELEKIAATVGNVTVAANQPTLDSDGNLFIPQPTRQLTLDDIAGAWGDNPGRIATTYVDRSTGVYVGTDSLHFTNKWTFDSSGRAANDFFEVRNGKKLSDNTTGRITIEGRLLSIRQKNIAKYVIRGWLELPNMTILKIAGPWFDDQEIPERVFNDFGPDSRFILTTKWVRTK